MMIQNFSTLATSKKKHHTLEILEAGLAAADPHTILPKFLTSHINVTKYSKIHTVAFGKAGDSMTRAANKILSLQSGIIVIPKGSKSLIKGKKFYIFNSGHPTPNRTSVQAAKEIIKFLKNKRQDELVIFLVSGGASALVALPDGITLDDKIKVTKLLLKSGATIQEFNCVRKHLSQIKGGKLVSNLKCDSLALVMSDVEGDDLSSIASGITFRDDTTCNDAIQIIEKYNLVRKMPENAWKILQARNLETPKKEKIPNHIIANNATCLDDMAKKAKQLGYNTETIQIYGNIKDAVKKILDHIPEKNGCLIFGGEPTVKVLGKGTGGRNHELVLRLLKNTQKSKLVISSMGTDGIDGNTNFAGAITETIKTDPQIIKEFLRNSDSAKFFQKRNSNILTGFTHTNLMDIGVILS